MSQSIAAQGAKKRDYWWTVLVIDPLAFPLANFLARKRWLSADQVTWLSLIVGVPMGLFYATGERWGLIAGAVCWFVAFLLDCVDGKLARALGTSSPKGAVLDDLADGSRRASGAFGLTVYLWRFEDGNLFLLAVGYGLLAFLFGQVSGGTRGEPKTAAGGRWTEALGRHRLLPTPGAPDVAAIAFFVGPIAGAVVPALIVADAAFSLAILAIMARMVFR